MIKRLRFFVFKYNKQTHGDTQTDRQIGGADTDSAITEDDMVLKL